MTEIIILLAIAVLVLVGKFVFFPDDEIGDNGEVINKRRKRKRNNWQP